jgi:hypothetical protein
LSEEILFGVAQFRSHISSFLLRHSSMFRKSLHKP